MQKHIYIHSDGTLERKDNTLRLTLKDGTKRVIPIETVETIFVFGELNLNKRVLEFLNQKGVVVHFFNYYGFYSGSFYPREVLNNGLILLKQVEHYLDHRKRLSLAKSFLVGGTTNILKLLKDYSKRIENSKELNETIELIKLKLEELKNAESVEELMQIEANIRKEYYSSWNLLIGKDGFKFQKREKRPPNNPINALISFGNSLLYTATLGQIYRTYLDPRIGYLHETNRRSFSLNLDLAEVFKPIIVDRVILSIINKGLIKEDKHFEAEIGKTYLNPSGRKIFIKHFEEKLATTFKHKRLGKVSYKRLLRLECYKLYKHLLGEKEYQPFTG
jgi:CRISPR-associated protein Cas1